MAVMYHPGGYAFACCHEHSETHSLNCSANSKIARRPSQLMCSNSQQTCANSEECTTNDTKSTVRRRQLLYISGHLLFCANVTSATAQQDTCDRVITQPGTLSKAGRQPLTERLMGKEQVYYPKWLFGEWEATATPKSESWVDDTHKLASQQLAIHSLQRSIAEGSEPQETHYTVRFFSTLPDTLANQINMNIGRLPQDAIVADRSFNLMSVANAAAGYDLVTSSQYDAYESPDLQQLTIQSRSGGTQNVKLKLTRLQGSSLDGSPDTFCSAESYTQEYNGFDSSYEILTKFARSSTDVVNVRMREVYYSTSDRLAAVLRRGSSSVAAVYEHDIVLKRIPPPSDAFGAAACVQTPKDFVQCM